MKTILLDRDGVINQDSYNYIRSVDEFIFIPRSKEAVALLTAAGYCIGIATNQSGVSRGFYSEDELQAIHQKMISEIRAAGGEIAAIEYCIHLPSEGCYCRKPQPGLLKKLAQKIGCELKDTAFVGDRVSDVRAALSVGARPIMVLSTMTDKTELAAYSTVPIYSSLYDYVVDLLRNDH